MTGSRHKRSRRASRGFTLVEMAIVVVIVGILAVIAVVAYRKLINSAHMSEATHMVNGIRVAQEAYHAETQTYLNVSTALTVGSLYPQQTPTRVKTGWGGPCGWCNAQWTSLPVHADGSVMYGYATMAGQAGGAPPAPPTVNGTSMNVTFPATTVTDWYVISAFGDVDGNGFYSAVLGQSWTNDVFTYFDGE